MAIDNSNSATTRLLTLLNVSATKVGKRKRNTDDVVVGEKLNKRRTVVFETDEGAENASTEIVESTETELVRPASEVGAEEGEEVAEQDEEGASEGEDDTLHSRDAVRFCLTA